MIELTANNEPAASSYAAKGSKGAASMPTTDASIGKFLDLTCPDFTGVVASATNDALMVTGTDNRILFVNPAFSRITGFSPAELIGQEPFMWRTDRSTPEFYRQMWQMLQDRGFWEGDLWTQNKAGQAISEWTRIYRLPCNVPGDVFHVALFTDVSSRRRLQARSVKSRLTDGLTGLPNRLCFVNELRAALGRTGVPSVTVIVMNIDQFRRVNEQAGHEGGDRLLNRTACALRQQLRATDLLARLAGDEFAVLLANPIDNDDALSLVRDMQLAIANAGKDAVLSDPLTASAGIVIHTGPCADPCEESELMLRNAIAAVDDARRAGHHRVAIHTEESAARRLARQTQERALRKAIETNTLALHFQPKVDLQTGAVIGAEALVRWHLEGTGDIPPAQFIPLAEECGLIHRIGEITLEKAFAALAAWMETDLPPVPVSVNVSAVQLDGRLLAAKLRDLLRASTVPPELVEIEVTETAFAHDMEGAIAELQAVRAMGVRIALDDFGTGYATLSLLQRLPIDTLKIDRSFVSDMIDSRSSEEIVRMVVALARALGKDLVAEGVETVEQSRRLVELGCEAGQGWLYARAMPVDALMAFIERNRGTVLGRAQPNTPQALRRMAL
ncbi:hypothetical protein CHU95_03750 [Niveispirillum lacus]|uniref:Diguanylate cyclase n=1 Tax=Niveispirillum lacus TaxID=1981099 RepID=A0A255Z580_9PROT|nr:GGDEF domain-containing phosphodiesterase [Niveispirillum lacus]OYQ36687.1 hypothetical protein CHU95_03750 [Niveispirillum lacus]